MATPNAPLIAKGVRSVLVQFCYKETNTNFMLKNVLHVPNSTENLILAGALQDAKVVQVIDGNTSLYSQFGTHIFAQGVRCGNNLFLLELTVIKALGPVLLITIAPRITFSEAHRHLAHIGLDKLEHMCLANQMGGLTIEPCSDTTCVECLKVNMKCFLFAPRVSRSSTRLEHVHTDLAGPLPISIDKHAYFLAIRDYYTHFSWVIMLPTKDKVVSALTSFDNLCVTPYNRHIGCIESDNGRKFINKAFSDYCSAHGIQHLMTVPHHLQINGAAE